MIKTLYFKCLCMFIILALHGCSDKEKQPDHIWDISIPWGTKVFHTQNAYNFAAEIKRRTQGRVVINIHPGGILGIKGPESMRAIGEGIVDGAEMAAFQQTGLEPILGLEALPFIVNTHEELALLYEDLFPSVDGALRKRNLVPLYIVPWPNQNIYTKEAVSTLADIKGKTIRTYDAQSTQLMERLGMAALQMPNGDVVPALASGVLDTTMTSTTTGAAQKYWEFLTHIYRTNHVWVSNVLAINKDRFDKLEPELQQIVINTAKEMQDGFWRISKSDDLKQLKTLTDNGIISVTPSPEFMAQMQAQSLPLIEKFKSENPSAGTIIDAYLKKKSEGKHKAYNFNPQANSMTKDANNE